MKKLIIVFLGSIFLIGNVAFAQSYKDMKSEYKKESLVKGMKQYSPTTATILSFILPGVGQMYAGEIGRGIGFLLGSLTATTAYVIGIMPQTQIIDCKSSYYNQCSNQSFTSANSPGLAILGLASSVGITIWSMVDASKVANVKNAYNIKKMEQEKAKQEGAEKKSSFVLPQITPVVINHQNNYVPGVGVSFKF